MRTFGVVVGLLLLAPAPVAAWTAEDPSGPTCRGVPATIVIGPDGSPLGTDGPDVVVVQRGAEAAFVDTGAGDDLVCIVNAPGPLPAYMNDFAVGVGDGDDVVLNEAEQAREGSDLGVSLGPGDDEFHGNESPEHVTADEGDVPGADLVSTAGGADHVATGVVGRANSDGVDLGPGSDFVWYFGPMSATGSLDGRGGRDRLWLSREGHRVGEAFPPGTVAVDNTRGTATVGGTPWARWSGLEMFGLHEVGARDVRFTGSDAAEHLLVNGRGRRVAAFGGGDDVLESSGRVFPPGRYDGGVGRDRLEVIGGRRPVSLDLRRRLDTGDPRSPSRALLRGFEDADVSAYRVRVSGSSDDNRLRIVGNDVVVDALGGSDEVRMRTSGTWPGAAVRHLARGDGGDDVLHDGRSDGRLVGGPGRDEARGGGGTDHCVAEVRRGCELGLAVE